VVADAWDKGQNGLKVTEVRPEWQAKAKIGFNGVKVAGKDTFKAINGLKSSELVGKARNKARNSLKATVEAGGQRNKANIVLNSRLGGAAKQF
jgi:hypothetical protein